MMPAGVVIVRGKYFTGQFPLCTIEKKIGSRIISYKKSPQDKSDFQIGTNQLSNFAALLVQPFTLYALPRWILFVALLFFQLPGVTALLMPMCLVVVGSQGHHWLPHALHTVVWGRGVVGKDVPPRTQLVKSWVEHIQYSIYCRRIATQDRRSFLCA